MIKLYNSLSRKTEEFIPMNSSIVSVYTCGPTVYSYPTIGNWRTYVLSDIFLRTLKASGFENKFIMNITDVGHLTGDNEGDADTGEDRLEKAAKKEKKTAWDVANYYADDFINGYNELNLTLPEKFTKATDHINEQIDLVKKIEEKGFAYKIADGIYFDVKAYESKGNTYGDLSNLDAIKEGARVEPNPDKKNPRDFALWKFSYPNGRDFDHTQDDLDSKRDMEWESPWGIGFPGWHIECSAMSMKYLGDQLDAHLGGEDLKSTHHPNEIAQTEAATGKKPFVKYWLHGAFLMVDGGRMGKSLGNAYNLHDIKQKGFSPLDLKYFYLTAHYRKQQNFTWEALEGAKSARERLNTIMKTVLSSSNKRTMLSPEKLDKVKTFQTAFIQAVSNDLNMPEALAVVWETIMSNISSEDKYDLLITFDEVLGLDLSKISNEQKNIEIPHEIKLLIEKRELLRSQKQFDKADDLRKQIEEKGYSIEDTPHGNEIIKIK